MSNCFLYGLNVCALRMLAHKSVAAMLRIRRVVGAAIGVRRYAARREFAPVACTYLEKFRSPRVRGVNESSERSTDAEVLIKFRVCQQCTF